MCMGVLSLCVCGGFVFQVLRLFFCFSNLIFDVMVCRLLLVLLHSVWHFDFYLNKHIAFHFDFRFHSEEAQAECTKKITIKRRWGNGTHTHTHKHNEFNRENKFRFARVCEIYTSIYSYRYWYIVCLFVCFWRRRCCRRRTPYQMEFHFIVIVLCFACWCFCQIFYPSISVYPHLRKSSTIPSLLGPSRSFFLCLSFSLFIWVQASISGCLFSLFASFHFISMIKEREKRLIWYWYFLCQVEKFQKKPNRGEQMAVVFFFHGCPAKFFPSSSFDCENLFLYANHILGKKFHLSWSGWGKWKGLVFLRSQWPSSYVNK